MPGYIDKVLQRFAPHLSIGDASPAVYIPPKYGNPTQTPTSDTSPSLSLLEIKTLQEQVGCLLYYARGVDATILPAVNHIAFLDLKHALSLGVYSISATIINQLPSTGHVSL